MGLSNLTFPTVVVKTLGGDLAVRGLSPHQILGLYYRHRDELTKFYQALIDVKQGGRDFTFDDATLIGMQMLDAAPKLVAEIIVIASGTHPGDPKFDGELGIAMNLSLAEHLDALEKIAAQTFTSDMPPGKMLALVMKAMQAGTSALKPSLPQA